MKRFLLLMLLAVSYSAMQADQIQTLIVQLKNGLTSTAGDTSFALSDVLRFTYAKIHQ